ncbi:MAG: MBOAT family O-acyltransferase [Elainellaceae cyanobacterium]
MIFSSLQFVFLFLPIVLGVFFLIGHRGWHQAALAWLVIASLFFYGVWNPAYLILILLSIAINYALGRLIQESRTIRPQSASFLTVAGVLLNLGLLGYYKYANFFVDNFNTLLDTDIVLKTIILPLGISFFTFQQMAYIIDVSKGHINDNNFLRYCLFVTFFPQLIAGPIVHHDEMMPQFAQRDILKPSMRAIAIGLTLFTLGLFKKVMIADTIAGYGNSIFRAAMMGEELSFFTAWLGAIAYTFQLYFDFSGYADMSIGIAYMLKIKLPLNFFSPYKSVDIIDFWRRWHMTLSRFLKDYIYIPLGGNRKGKVRRYVNLLTTMLLGGLWHGAGWTFVIWGGLHGIYLVINHAWRGLENRFGWAVGESVPTWRSLLSIGVTFIAVTVSWVLFRANDLSAAGVMLQGMIGRYGFDWVTSSSFLELEWVTTLVLLAAIGLAFFCPNAYELLERYRPALETYRTSAFSTAKTWFHWMPSQAWAIIMGLMFGVSILGMSRVSEFLYFQF